LIVLAVPVFEARFLGISTPSAVALANVQAANKTKGNATGNSTGNSTCPAADKLEGEIKKMKANDEKFMPKIMELKDELAKCRKKEGEAAQKKADAKTEKAWTKSHMQKVEEETAALAAADPKKKEAKKEGGDKKGGEKKGGKCPEADKLKKEFEEMKPNDEKFLPTVLDWKKEEDKCEQKDCC